MSTLTHLEVPAVHDLEANHTAGYAVLHGGPGGRKSREAAPRHANEHWNNWLTEAYQSARVGFGMRFFVCGLFN